MRAATGGADPSAALATFLRAHCGSFFSEAGQLLLLAERALDAAAGGSIAAILDAAPTPSPSAPSSSSSTASTKVASGPTVSPRDKAALLDASLRRALAAVAASDVPSLSTSLPRLCTLVKGYAALAYYGGVVSLVLGAGERLSRLSGLELWVMPPEGEGEGSGAASSTLSVVTTAAATMGAATTTASFNVPPAMIAAATDLRLQLYCLVIDSLAALREGTAAGLQQQEGGEGLTGGIATPSPAPRTGGGGGGGVTGVLLSLFHAITGLGGGAASTASAVTANAQQQQPSAGGVAGNSTSNAGFPPSVNMLMTTPLSTLGRTGVAPAPSPSESAFRALLGDITRCSVDALLHDTLYRWLLGAGLSGYLTTAGVVYLNGPPSSTGSTSLLQAASAAPSVSFLESFLATRAADPDLLFAFYVGHR